MAQASGEKTSFEAVSHVKYSGLDAVQLRHPNGAVATVTLHGANVVEWTAGNGSKENILFVSKEAVFNGKKAIRGGIPLVFPQFGAGLNGPTGLPSHGFARISKWNLAAGGFDDLSFESTPFSGRVFADFSLESKDIYVEGHDSPWLNGDISFRLVFRVELGPGSLRTSLTVTNTHDASTAEKVPFTFQALFHTYYNVPDSTKVAVHIAAPQNADGQKLTALTIHDKMTPDEPFRSVEAPHTQIIAEEVDRIFHKVAPTIRADLSDSLQVAIKVRKVVSSAPTVNELMDTVVWNPWIAKAERMGDFGNDEYKTMICVEPGRVAADDVLEPGHWARLDQHLFARNIVPKAQAQL